ncbi:MAG: ABC transporter substrate-binding protein [Candidatus Thorarchaeota archaeon]
MVFIYESNPTNTTTTSSSPTTTTPPTTTTTPENDTTPTPDPTVESLTILTRYDTSVQSVFETVFLASDYAIENGINGIQWRTVAAEYWDDIIEAGTADICWGGGPTLFDELMTDNNLLDLNSTLMQEVQDRIPDSIAGSDMKRLNDTDHLVWIAAAISTCGFTVNHQFLDDKGLPIPDTWTDLANATYGQFLKAIPTIAMGNAPDTTSNTRIYEIITQGIGWEEGWATMARMAGSAQIYAGSVETQSAVETGAVGISMSIDFYGYQTQYRNPDCEYIIPVGQSIVNGNPIAIPISTSNRESSEAFLNFVLSADGQALWLDSTIRRMPIMEEAFHTPVGLAATDLYSVFNQTIKNVGIDFDEDISSQINTAFASYFESVYNDAHDELVNCWGALIDAYLDATITLAEFNLFADVMGALVIIEDPNTSVIEEFTLDYAISINGDMISNSTYYNAVQNAWTSSAIAQYAAVLASLSALIASR